MTRMGVHQCLYTRRATSEGWVWKLQPVLPPALQCHDWLGGRGGPVILHMMHVANKSDCDGAAPGELMQHMA